jgi:hypothetical protein
VCKIIERNFHGRRWFIFVPRIELSKERDMSLAYVVGRRMTFALAVILLVSTAVFSQDAADTSTPLVIQPGTILTVRINEPITSNRNQSGDVFSATLDQPLVVQGIVVAQRGQTAAGRVVETKKAGMVSGVSRLGITLTRLTLVDGQNVPVHSQLLVRRGATSRDRDAAAVVGTTGLGAAIGAAADWGQGAAIGAGAGAAAGTLGVLLTRGHSTVIYPETLLTFQVTVPVTIYTDDAPGAFRAVNPADYAQAETQREEQSAVPPVVAPPPSYPYPYPYNFYYGLPYSPYYYPYYPYPYFNDFYGSSFSFFIGYPRYYGYAPGYRYRPYYGYRYRPYYGYRDHDRDVYRDHDRHNFLPRHVPTRAYGPRPGQHRTYAPGTGSHRTYAPGPAPHRGGTGAGFHSASRHR